ncbi:hypothetical protein [Geobacter anodireducens]
MGNRRATIALAALQLLLVLFVQLVPFAHVAAGAKDGPTGMPVCRCNAGGCCAAMSDMPRGCRCEGACAVGPHGNDYGGGPGGTGLAVISCGCCADEPGSPLAVPLVKWECILPAFLLESGISRCTVNLSHYSGMRTAFPPEPSTPPPEG